MHQRKTNANAKATTLVEQLGSEDTWLDKVLHPFVWLRVRIREKRDNLRYRCQRFKKGYSDYDVWEMRDWFIRIAKPMLREMSAKADNYPGEIGEEQWRKILQEMADLLEIMDIWDDSAARKQASLSAEDNSPEAMQLISTEKEKAKDRFFFLFNKWFYDLWY